MFRRTRGRMVLALIAPAILLAWGCGGGGGAQGSLAGTVTDVDNQGIAGARVFTGSRSTTSLSNGTFTLSDVGEGLKTVRAEIDIKGHRWSGETVVDLVGDEHNRSVSVVVSDERFQGSIAGRVVGPGGGGLSGAKVFVNVKIPNNGTPYTFGSTMAVTDSDGFYEAPRLTSGVRYIVTASLAGFINQTQEDVLVRTGEETPLSFALARNTSQGPIPAPTGLFAQAWTVQTDIRRADGRTKAVYEWLKRSYRKKAGLPEGPQARNIEWKNTGRITPAGSVVEIDLFWDYQQYNDLLGYVIRRAIRPGTPVDTALLRDPLAGLFFDVDPSLTPDVIYDYTVHRVDTVEFPDNGTVGPASDKVSAQPFLPIRGTSPGQGQGINGDPVFRWTRVDGANAYQIYVWDRFPDLTNPNDPDSAPRLWPADVNNPGSSLVTGGNTTQQTYNGPALTRGRTYYWVVIALDSSSQPKTFSASQISRFVAQ